MLQPRGSSARELEASLRSPVPVPTTAVELEFPAFPPDFPCCMIASEFEILHPRQEI